MKRSVTFGYGETGKFSIVVVEQERGESEMTEAIQLSRAECLKIVKLMEFGKKGEVRVVETVDGRVVKP